MIVGEDSKLTVPIFIKKLYSGVINREARLNLKACLHQFVFGHYFVLKVLTLPMAMTLDIISYYCDT